MHKSYIYFGVYLLCLPIEYERITVYHIIIPNTKTKREDIIMTYTTSSHQIEHFPLLKIPINSCQCGFIPMSMSSVVYFLPLKTNVKASMTLNAICDSGCWSYYLIIYDLICDTPNVLQLPCKLNLWEKILVHYYVYKINREYEYGRGSIVKAQLPQGTSSCN